MSETPKLGGAKYTTRFSACAALSLTAMCGRGADKLTSTIARGGVAVRSHAPRAIAVRPLTMSKVRPEARAYW